MKKKEEEKNSQTRADQLEERLIEFAVRIIKLKSRFPKTPAGKTVNSARFSHRL